MYRRFASTADVLCWLFLAMLYWNSACGAPIKPKHGYDFSTAPSLNTPSLHPYNGMSFWQNAIIQPQEDKQRLTLLKGKSRTQSFTLRQNHSEKLALCCPSTSSLLRVAIWLIRAMFVWRHWGIYLWRSSVTPTLLFSFFFLVKVTRENNHLLPQNFQTYIAPLLICLNMPQCNAAGIMKE